MKSQANHQKISDCDKKSLAEFLKTVKSTIGEIKDFNLCFVTLLEKQKSQVKEIASWVTRYNILNAGPPCVYPIIQKEELLQEMLQKIQEKTNSTMTSLSAVKEKFVKLPNLQKVLEKQSLGLNWNPSTNPSIKHSVHHLPPSQYLEDISDVLFQFDISLTCIFLYADALDLHDVKTYDNFSNSFSISAEVVDLINELVIKYSTLLLS